MQKHLRHVLPDAIKSIFEPKHVYFLGRTSEWQPVFVPDGRLHDDVIKWKQFPRYWPIVRGIHRSPVNSLHKVQWRGALMFSLIYARINGWVNNREAGDLRRYRAHYDITVMLLSTVDITKPAIHSCIYKRQNQHKMIGCSWSSMHFLH